VWGEAMPQPLTPSISIAPLNSYRTFLFDSSLDVPSLRRRCGRQGLCVSRISDSNRIDIRQWCYCSVIYLFPLSGFAAVGCAGSPHVLLRAWRSDLSQFTDMPKIFVHHVFRIVNCFHRFHLRIKCILSFCSQINHNSSGRWNSLFIMFFVLQITFTNSFENDSQLRHIESDAFYCSALESMTIPRDVDFIKCSTIQLFQSQFMQEIHISLFNHHSLLIHQDRDWFDILVVTM
jgi:hypothetical protein